jgi:signal transduction histidine kinase/hydroxymethylpyrimidine pyrophosphatase-like HAD family hydrolase
MAGQSDGRTRAGIDDARLAIFILLSFSLVGLLTLSPKFLRAQQPNRLSYKQIQVKTLNFEDGLMNNGTYGVATDVMGYTWVSTETGLQRYNGYRLEKITPVVGRDTIPILSPVALFALRNGMLWICYRQGVLEYSPFSSSFRRIVTLPPSANFAYPLNPICETNEGIWCLLRGRTLGIYDRQGRLCQEFPLKGILAIWNSFQLGYPMNNRLYAVSDNRIFFRDSTGGLLQVDLQSHRFKSIPWAGPSLVGIACDSAHLYLLSGMGLYAMRPDGRGNTAYLPLQALTGEMINAAHLTVTSGNELMLGLNNHLFQLDGSLQSWKEFITSDSKPVLTTGTVNYLYRDQFRRLWLLSNDDIREIRDIGLPFQHFMYPSAPNNFVRCLYLDDIRHFILAGCFNGGVQLYDSTGRPLWEKPFLSDSAKNIIGIAKLTGNDFLLITLGRGWYLFNLEQKRISPMKIDPVIASTLNPRNNQFGNNLQSIDDSTVFVATIDNVYRCLFRGSQLKEAKALFPPAFIRQNRIRCFIYTSDHSVWAGGDRGMIYTVNPKGELNQFQIRGESPIRCITEDRRHQLWAGSEKGAYIYSPAGEWKSSITTDNGLLNDCIYAMLPLPNEAAVFASSNLGLSYISGNGDVRNFTREMGLQENEFNNNSCWAASDGKFLFGGINGISAFYPAALTEMSDTPILNITHLTVNDSSYQFPSPAWSGDSILLEYDHNHLVFDIAAFGILSTNEYNYKYRVKGFETSWQSTRYPRGVRYTLSPGTYFLEIVCSPLHSTTFNVTRSFTIVIRPPWWQRWWALSLALIALVAAVAIVVWRYNRWKYQKKIRQLQARNELQNERERISRELHDNIGTQLSLISSNVDWLLEAPESLKADEKLRRLSAVNETAKDLVSDLRETIWAIKKEAIQLDELADKLKMFLLSKCTPDPSIKLEIKEDIRENRSLSPVEALNIFRICQEALVNSFKHARASQLFISIESNDRKTYAFVISDNGDGFVQTGGSRGHYGLENMRHRALEIGARLSVESVPGSGTRVLLEKETE